MKLNTHLAYIITQQLLSWALIPKKQKHNHKKPVLEGLQAALFVIAQNWKQPDCPLTGQDE